jgi:peroxiredoxin
MSPPYGEDVNLHISTPTGYNAPLTSHTGNPHQRYPRLMDIEPTSDDAVASESAEDPVDQTAESTPSTSGQWWAVGIAAMAALIVGVLVVSQVRLISSLDDARSDIASLESQIESVGDSVDTLVDDVAGVADDVADVATDVAESAGAGPSVDSGGSSPLTPPTNAAPAGYLPRFDSQAPDQAIGMKLGEIQGVDAYTDNVETYDPADGTKRVWMVWAHWCPFCQQELPELSDWYPTVEDRYSTELVTVTTSISPERGNPLEEYLDVEQFPFPVIVDPESALAVQMGVSAFPFWMVTDGDGEVLLRATGLLHLDQVINLFDQLENLGV